MKHIIKYSILLVLMVTSSRFFGQQDPMYTQYMFNAVLINPAYAGTHKIISATAMSRWQWVGLDDAPRTHTFSIHSPFNDKRNALGATIISDKLGATQQTGIWADYAYKILFRKTTLSLGLQGGFNHVNYQDINIKDIDDPSLNNDDYSRILPNFGMGLFYFSSHYYLGLSIPHFVNNPFRKNNTVSEARQSRHYFLTGGYVFGIAEDIKLKPNFMIKFVSGATPQVDLNANVMLKKFFWVGLSYRSFESLDLLLEVNPKPNIRIGYSFDLITSSNLGPYTNGTHELMLNYRFTLEKEELLERHYTPRVF